MSPRQGAAERLSPRSSGGAGGAATTHLPRPEVPAPQKAGRPRSEACRQRILTAARDLLEERGLRAITMEAIAERAGSSKVTVYRWWSHKAAVVIDAMLAEISPRVSNHDALSPLEALRSEMHSLSRFLQGRHGRLLVGIVAEGVLDPEIGEAYRQHWLKPRRDGARLLVERAVLAGELMPGLDVDVTIDAMFGPLYYRFLINHAALSAAYSDGIFDSVLAGVASPKTRAGLTRPAARATPRSRPATRSTG